MITNKDEAKSMTEIFNLFVNASSIVQHVIQNKHGTTKHVHMNVKIVKKNVFAILIHAFVRIVSI